MEPKACQLSAGGKIHLSNFKPATFTSCLTLCGRKLRFRSASKPSKEFDGGADCCAYCARQYRMEWGKTNKLEPILENQ